MGNLRLKPLKPLFCVLTLILTLTLMLVSQLLLAETGAPSSDAGTKLLKPGHPIIYDVKDGDTLWDIASVFLIEPWKWPEIWHINPDIENPHLIHPGDVLKLIYMEGRPKLVVERSGVKSQLLADGTLKLSPKPRVESIDSVIPAVPLDAIQSFLVNHRVIDYDEVDAAPRVIAGNEGHLIMGVGDYLYARGDFDGQSAAYGFFREGQSFVDPITEEYLGFSALRLGVGRVATVSADIAKISLLSSSRDVRIGDRLLPTVERKVNSVFFPKSPNKQITGHLIHVFGGVRNVSQFDVVVISKGQREELEEGDILAMYRTGAQIRDEVTNELIQLPGERAGLTIVFRTFEKVSFGLVIVANTLMQVGDEVRNP